jgi:WXG100 family type VII secretion target
MSKIRIDYSALAQQSSALKNCCSTYESLASRMNNMWQQITTNWEGSAAESYGQLMQQYAQQAKIIIEIIQTIQGYADKTSSSFQAIDQESANLIRNSF